MEEKEHTPGNEPMSSLPCHGAKPLDILSRLEHKVRCSSRTSHPLMS